MYNRNNARSSRASSFGKRGNRSNSRFGKRNFSSSAINVNRFICKAETIKAEDVFKPQCAFCDLAIHDVLKRSIANRGFAVPTPIQDQAIPAILAGQDLIGLANTGTGKTAAYLIPMLNKILINPQEKVLVVVPTRELAMQIQEEFVALARRLNIFSVAVVGGAFAS